MHNSSSLVGITVFFLQTLVLLPRQGLHLGMVGDGFEALQDSLSLWPDWPDQDDGDSLSSGLFALDYFAKYSCLLYTSPSPRDATLSRMPSSA